MKEICINPKRSPLLETLASSIIGQPQFCETVVPYLVTGAYTGYKSDRPVGVFLLLGPTGTGKTHSVEQVAKYHSRSKKPLHINCGEYAAAHEISRLIGSPPGYIGHRETRAVLDPQNLENYLGKNGQGVILLDEIEKADPAFHKIWLNIFDKGQCSLSSGTVTKFNGWSIFMTSNLGYEHLQKELRIGFSDDKRNIEALHKTAKEKTRRFFSAEFLNRVDETIVFNPLSKKDLFRIAQRAITEIEYRLGLSLEFDTPTINNIISEGDSIRHGAREIRRLVQKIITPLVEHMVNTSEDFEKVCIRTEKGQIKYYSTALRSHPNTLKAGAQD